MKKLRKKQLVLFLLVSLPVIFISTSCENPVQEPVAPPSASQKPACSPRSYPVQEPVAPPSASPTEQPDAPIEQPHEPDDSPFILINGVSYVVDTVEFYEDGTVKTGTLFGYQTIGEYRYNGEISFSEDGTVSSWTGTRYRLISGVSFVDSTVTVYSDGQVKTGTLSSSPNYQTIDGFKYKSSTTIEFYSDGQVKTGILYGDTIIGGVNYKGNTTIEFYSNGLVKTGTLFGYQTIGEYRYNGEISFSEDGTVSS
ncbi:MAG: hypothetical protein ACR2PY_00170, partial [Salinispira sp.]